jgi:hypothetical protein
MRTILKISAVLSWFNAIFWGLVIVILFLSALSFQNMPFVVFAFVLSAIVLHSYAALQLRKSIRNPAIQLSNHTPTGIRFVGFIALFLGACYMANGIALLQDPGGSLKIMQAQAPEFSKVLTIASLREGAVMALVLGLFIAVNVFLNFRLLRWYYLVKQSDIS